MMKFVKKYLKNERAQTSVEYILLLVVVALIVMRFRGVAVEGVKTLTEGVFRAGDGIVDELNRSSGQ